MLLFAGRYGGGGGGGLCVLVFVLPRFRILKADYSWPEDKATCWMLGDPLKVLFENTGMGYHIYKVHK